MEVCNTVWASLGEGLQENILTKLSLPEFVYPKAFPKRSDEHAITLLGDPNSANPSHTPNMLLAGLEQKEPLLLTDEKLRDKLLASMQRHPCAFLAVSGQGKTRHVCEQLSCSFGLLLIVKPPGSDTLNPGAMDMVNALNEMNRGVNKISGENAEQRHTFIEDVVATLPRI